MGTTRRDRRRIAYQPALDGLRAVAVLAVILYHHHRSAGVGRIGRIGRGGFLGVDVFFVLSGYLITALLLQEHSSTGSVAFGRFWGRRARRLLPALLVMLVLVVTIGGFAYGSAQQRAIESDLPYVLFYVQNWHIALWHGSLQSPIGHTWSLSVEEQFYLVWPVLLVAFVALTRNSPRRLLAVVGGLAVASAAWTAVWLSPLRAFFGTDARAQQLLVGATLAVIATNVSLSVPERFARRVSIGGAALLAGLIALLFGAPGSSDIWRHGGMFVFAIAVALLIAAGVQPRGVARAVLATPVLVAIGRISYGLYLFHFPVFLWIDSTGMPQVALLLVRLGVTFAIALTSYFLVEQPIRRGRWSWRVLVPVGIAVAAAALVVAPFDVGRPVPQPKSKLLGFVLASAARHTPAGARRVLVVGGNHAAYLTLASKGPMRVDAIWGMVVGTPGCGLTASSRRCRAVPDDLRALAYSFHASAVVFMPDELDRDGVAAGPATAQRPAAVTARLEAMRRAIGPRDLGILAIPCRPVGAAAADPLSAAVTRWARHHDVAMGAPLTGACDVGSRQPEPIAAEWQSIATLVRATHPTR